MISPKTTEDCQQNDIKLEPQDIQKSRTGLSQTKPWFLLDCCCQRYFAEKKFFFLISHLTYNLIYSFLNFERKIESMCKIYLRRYWQIKSLYKSYNFKRGIVYWKKQFFLALCRVKTVLVLECVIPAIAHFSICFRINNISKIDTDMIIQVLHLFIL